MIRGKPKTRLQFNYNQLLISQPHIVHLFKKIEKEKKEKEEVTVTTGGEGKEDLKSLSIEELQILLNEVLEQEDYIRAIAIRDELSNRKK